MKLNFFNYRITDRLLLAKARNLLYFITNQIIKYILTNKI